MSSTLPAVASLTGLQETTLARLGAAGLDQNGMVIIGDIVRFTGEDQGAIARYVEQGVGLKSLQAVAQLRRLSSAAESSSFENLVKLAHRIGEGFTYELEPGMTIYRGRVVTVAHAQELELAALQADVAKAGIDQPDSAETTSAAALLGGMSAPTSVEQPPSSEAKPERKQRIPVATFEAWSAQEKIMASLLELAEEVLSWNGDPADALNQLIAQDYDGNVHAAFHDLGRDEEAFKRQLSAYGPKKADLLLDHDPSDIVEEINDDEIDDEED